jgi:hypothetical protein
VDRIQSEVAIECLFGSFRVSNHEAGRVRVHVGVGGILEAHDIARIFNNQMLEASARANQWKLVFARVANAGQSSFETLMRTSGTAEEAVELCIVYRLIGRQPDRPHAGSENFRDVLEPGILGDVG